MLHQRTARPTLTPIELDPQDELHFTLANGITRKITLRRTSAKIIHTTLTTPKTETPGAVTTLRFFAHLTIDNLPITIVREIGTQKSFYEPRQLLGLNIWIDAVDDIFDHLLETHGPCRPRKKLRMMIQDATLRICPTLLHPWCPLPQPTIKIEDCYNGDDCWLGAYFGASAHGGLDINHPAGTPLYTPIEIHDHFYFNSLQNGDNNNRWRGLHHWPDGSTWILQSHHLVQLLIPEHQPIPAGTNYATSAGVLTGDHEHTHFAFKIREPNTTEADDIHVDPWILFWQTYKDRQLTTAKQHP